MENENGEGYICPSCEKPFDFFFVTSNFFCPLGVLFSLPD